MDIIIEWLEPWDTICTDGSTFEEELYKELGRNHILYGKKVSALGRRYDRDEYLFQVNNSNYKIAVVHLTFSGKEEKDNNYPRTKFYKDLDDWVSNCMVIDHYEFE